jgi:hypothetical protein
MIKISVFLLFCAIFLGLVLQNALGAPDLLQQFPVNAAPATTRGTAQSQVALKGAFPVVAKDELRGALDAKNLAAAKNLLAKLRFLPARLFESTRPKAARWSCLISTKLQKRAGWQRQNADFRRFPDLQTLKGKRVAFARKSWALSRLAPNRTRGAGRNSGCEVICQGHSSLWRGKNIMRMEKNWIIGRCNDRHLCNCLGAHIYIFCVSSTDPMSLS